MDVFPFNGMVKSPIFATENYTAFLMYYED